MGYFTQLDDKEEVVFLGLMELGWEVPRWAWDVIKYIKTHPDKRYVVATLVDRIDLYGEFIPQHPLDFRWFNVIMWPVTVDGIYTRIRPECWRLMGYDYGPIRQ